METKKITTTIGYRIECYDEITYHGGETANGVCYKDLTAFKKKTGVIYISETELNDLEQDINETPTWTYENWIDWVKFYLWDNYTEFKFGYCQGFVKYIAECVLEDADWQDLSTLLDEYDYNGDWIMDNWEWYQNDRKK